MVVKRSKIKNLKNYVKAINDKLIKKVIKYDITSKRKLKIYKLNNSIFKKVKLKQEFYEKISDFFEKLIEKKGGIISYVNDIPILIDKKGNLNLIGVEKKGLKEINGLNQAEKFILGHKLKKFIKSLKEANSNFICLLDDWYLARREIVNIPFFTIIIKYYINGKNNPDIFRWFVNILEKIISWNLGPSKIKKEKLEWYLGINEISKSHLKRLAKETYYKLNHDYRKEEFKKIAVKLELYEYYDYIIDLKFYQSQILKNYLLKNNYEEKLKKNLIYGLGKRVTEVDIIKSKLKNISIGICINEVEAFEIIEKGPDYNREPEKSEEFRIFWENKTELRKYRDLTIRETIEWKNLSDNTNELLILTIIKEIIKLKAKEIEMVNLRNQELIDLIPKDKNINSIYQKLSNEILNVPFRLKAVAVSGLSASLRGTDINYRMINSERLNDSDIDREYSNIIKDIKNLRNYDKLKRLKSFSPTSIVVNVTSMEKNMLSVHNAYGVILLYIKNLANNLKKNNDKNVFTSIYYKNNLPPFLDCIYYGELFRIWVDIPEIYELQETTVLKPDYLKNFNEKDSNGKLVEFKLIEWNERFSSDSPDLENNDKKIIFWSFRESLMHHKMVKNIISKYNSFRDTVILIQLWLSSTILVPINIEIIEALVIFACYGSWEKDINSNFSRMGKISSSCISSFIKMLKFFTLWDFNTHLCLLPNDKYYYKESFNNLINNFKKFRVNTLHPLYVKNVLPTNFSNYLIYIIRFDPPITYYYETKLKDFNSYIYYNNQEISNETLSLIKLESQSAIKRIKFKRWNELWLTRKTNNSLYFKLNVKRLISISYNHCSNICNKTKKINDISITIYDIFRIIPKFFNDVFGKDRIYIMYGDYFCMDEDGNIPISITIKPQILQFKNSYCDLLGCEEKYLTVSEIYEGLKNLIIHKFSMITSDFQKFITD